MALAPYFGGLAGFSPALAGLGMGLSEIQGSFLSDLSTPGLMSVTNETLSHGTGGGGSGAEIVRIQQDGLQKGEKPAVLLVTLMPDDSGSIASYGNAAAIRRGHNEYLETFGQSPGTVLVRTRYLNGLELFNHCKPKDAVRMDERNYAPNQGTPLYDQTYALLGEVMSNAALFAAQYKDHDILTMTCIITDGADTGSARTPADVKHVVDRMIASGQHIVAGIGVRDRSTDFARVFASMGIPEQWIKVLEREEGDIVEGMTQVAHSGRTIVGASSFHQTSMTGFTGQPGRTAAPRPAAAPVRPASTAVPAAKATGAANDDPFKPPAPAATAMPGASSIGNMMGATQNRGSAEIGGVVPQNLPWEPTQLAYLWSEASGADGTQPVPNPLQWNAAEGFYTLALPPPGTVYMFGRDGGQLQEEIRIRIRNALRVMGRKNKDLRLIYVPLRDKRPESPISRLHAMIGSMGSKVHSINALDGDVTVISSNDPSEDKYFQGKQGGSTFVDSGNRIKLAPHVVFKAV